MASANQHAPTRCRYKLRQNPRNGGQRVAQTILISTTVSSTESGEAQVADEVGEVGEEGEEGEEGECVEESKHHKHQLEALVRAELNMCQAGVLETSANPPKSSRNRAHQNAERIPNLCALGEPLEGGEGQEQA